MSLVYGIAMEHCCMTSKRERVHRWGVCCGSLESQIGCNGDLAHSHCVLKAAERRTDRCQRCRRRQAMLVGRLLVTAAAKCVESIQAQSKSSDAVTDPEMIGPEWKPRREACYCLFCGSWDMSAAPTRGTLASTYISEQYSMEFPGVMICFSQLVLWR